ncbi:MAG: hypothetical protein AAGE01_19745 [Pseudomonadota bacterium]
MPHTLAQLALLMPLVAAGSPAAPPSAVAFGATVEATRAELAKRCDRLDVRALDPAALPIAQESHLQLDCHGFEHAGAARLAEFVFADDALAFVWVLTEAAEEAALRDQLIDAFGDPSHETPEFIAFVDHRVALRRDKPELLYYGAAVAPLYEAWFDAR